MKPGKAFEKQIQDACAEQCVDFTRLRDAGWRGEETERRFTVKNICDAVLYYRGAILFAEMKRRQSALRFDDITQYDDLRKKWKPSEGVYSGVFCELKGVIYFLTFADLEKLKAESGKQSFNGKDAGEYGRVIEMVLPPRKRKARPRIDQCMLGLAANDSK